MKGEGLDGVEFVMAKDRELAPNAENEAPSTGRVPFADEATDARLVEAVRRGDEDAFATLVARYERKLLRVLGRLVRDRELARDLGQETFWRAYSRLHRFDASRRFGPWLFRIGVNLAVDWLRRKPGPPILSIDRASGEHSERDDQRFELVDPDPRGRDELAQEVQFVLDQIPLAYRTILVLRELEGFSTAEVAAITGRQEATIRWRLAKSREMFRERWERRGGDGNGKGGGAS